MSLDEFNGVRSTIIDKQTDPPVGNVSRNATFIFGTAKSGAKHTPTTVTAENVREIFGTVPLDSSFDTSLVRGYYEYVQSCKGIPDVKLVRVGITSPARIDLYENNTYLSGELSYSLDTDSAAEKSMFIQALTEGADMNDTLVTITEDDISGAPTYMNVELPDGTTVGYNLSLSSNAPGVISRVSQLCTLINSNETLNGKVFAGFTALEKDIEVTVAYSSGTTIQSTYELDPVVGSANESWGDKLISIVTAYQDTTVEQELEAGELLVELDVLPEKDMTGNDTIETFIRLSNMESVLTVTPNLVGTLAYTKALYCADVSGWSPGYTISGDTDHDWLFALYVRRSGSTTATLLELTTDYTLNTTTGVVTLVKALQLGDRFYATYRYEVTYGEAKYKSDLLTGSDRSYFIFGDQIMFGANQPAPLIIYYDTKVYMDASDIKIESYSNPTITFKNTSDIPAFGEVINITIQYEPELPAGSGKILDGTIVQPGSLSGGSDGRNVGKAQYRKNIKAAMKAVDLYPRRHNVVMGMWLDELVSGFNAETGLAEEQPMNMFSDVLPYIDRSSNLTNECDVDIPVLPLGDLSQDSITDWITNLTENSGSELNRTSNIIDSINNFRANAPLGVFIVSIPEVNNGRKYFANPACVYSGYKQNLAYDRSATNDFVPGNIQDLGVKIFNAEVIGKLNLKRYTTAVINHSGTFIWADAPTLGIKYRSQYDRQFVRETVFLAVSFAREVAEKYIGKPRLPQYLLSMKKDVLKALGMLTPEVLSDFAVDLVPISDGYITGKTKLKLMLVTAKEIRSVELETSISLVQ